MPVRPVPTTYRCPACHWSKTTAPRSDVLLPGDYFSACPVCGHVALVTRPASWMSVVLEKVGTNMQRIFKKPNV